jgi:putative exosortase-associated protein (TIGR04073 family)
LQLWKHDSAEPFTLPGSPTMNRLLIGSFFLLTLMAIPQASTAASDKEYIAEAVAPEAYVENASYKLLRGLTNIVTSPAEIPKQITVTTRDRGAAIGPVLGLFKGLGMTLMRAGFGILETVTFPLPNDIEGSFAPILKPEYVWDPSPPIQR